jgi:hypothetical protein
MITFVCNTFSVNSLACRLLSLLFIINRSVEDRPTQKSEKALKKSIMKQPAFAGPSSSRALPPKKRKVSAEELPVQVRLSSLIYSIM